ncbi:hypothetical protein [Brevibacterium album]|uniref:hypothetical protein n=1 Tax=Brevibacterium album TaxID=417948 RepID=UPI000424ECD8|nr:hypothetical protein [Brevibacterium album]
MYTLLNNLEASKLDLYLPGRLVASLHYAIRGQEMEFVYCEAIEVDDAAAHCTELLGRAVREARSKRLTVVPSCSIARTYLALMSRAGTMSESDRL